MTPQRHLLSALLFVALHSMGRARALLSGTVLLGISPHLSRALPFIGCGSARAQEQGPGGQDQVQRGLALAQHLALCVATATKAIADYSSQLPEALATLQQLPPRVFPTFRSRADFGDILSKMNLTVGVEVGVRRGDHAQFLLSRWQKCRQFLLVDAYRRQKLQYTQNQSWFDNTFKEMFQKRIIRRNCEQSFQEALSHPRCQMALWLCRDWSHKCADSYADQSFDFIYLDALHDRKGVLRDLRTWWPKLRSGGVMAGHDYHDFESYNDLGFIKAAHKYSVNYDGTYEKSGRLLKGAVDDFFACVVADEKDKPPPLGWLCDHFRQVAVSYAIGPLDESAPSWAVRK